MRTMFRKCCGPWDSIFSCSDHATQCGLNKPFTATGNSTPEHGFAARSFLRTATFTHPPENSELLMYRGGLDRPWLFVTELDLDANSLSKTITKIHLNRIRGDIRQSAHGKSCLEVFGAPLVRFMRFLSAYGRLGIVLQEEIAHCR